MAFIFFVHSCFFCPFLFLFFPPPPKKQSSEYVCLNIILYSFWESSPGDRVPHTRIDHTVCFSFHQSEYSSSYYATVFLAKIRNPFFPSPSPSPSLSLCLLAKETTKEQSDFLQYVRIPGLQNASIRTHIRCPHGMPVHSRVSY